MTEVICVIDACDRLGEGPCWDAAAGRLYWFDIKQLKLHWLEPASGSSGEWALSVQASAAAPRAGGGLILATVEGLAVFDTSSGELDLRACIPAPPGFRTNDGKIDVHGRFWWSHMDKDEGKAPGRVLLTDSEWRTTTALEGVHIANAVSTSPDGRTFYLADSARKTLFAYDLDPASGELTNRRVFAHTHEQGGAPDGAAVDANGFIWSCHWGASRIVRYAPDGSIDRIQPMPVEQPSSCAFGGPDLATLYVTSAWDGLSEQARARQPHAGGLFAFQPGVSGLALPPFGG